MHGPTLARRTRLDLQSLETRETPANVVNATFAAGVLTLTGNDYDNSVLLIQTGTTIEVQGSDGTSIDGGTKFTDVTSVRALLKDGDDRLVIDATADFVLTGAVTIDLGDGDNTVGLVTSGKLSLGALTITSGDGLDRFAIEGGPDSQVTGNVSVAQGIGRGRQDPADMVSRTTITGLTVHGPGGLRFTAADGDDELILTRVTVDHALTAKGGVGDLSIQAINSHLGPVTINGTTDPLNTSSTVDLAADTTTIAGPVLLKSAASAEFGFTDVISGPVAVQAAHGYSENTVHGTVTVNGTVSVTASTYSITLDQVPVENPPPDGSDYGTPSVLDVHGDLLMGGGGGDIWNYGSVVRARNLTLSGNQVQYSQYYDQDYGESVLDLTGNLLFRAGSVEYYQTDGTAEIDGNVRLLGGTWSGFDNNVGGTGNEVLTTVRGSLTQSATTGEANHEIDGGSMAVTGNVTVTGAVSAKISYETDAPSEIGGTVTLNGGSQNDSFWARGNFKSKSVTLNMKNGNNWAVIGSSDPTRPTTIDGNLKMTSGSGTDTVTVVSATIAGTTTIATGAGADELILQAGTVFTGGVAVNLGSGADVFTAGLEQTDPFDPTTVLVPAGTVTFHATSSIRMGAGNDRVQLGEPPPSDGKAVVAVGATLTVDGGLNLDTLVPGQTEGTVLTPGFELP